MTPERFHRLRAVLDRRQPDLTVLMDNVHKVHNFSAIVRSCDAVGAFEAHAVWPHRELIARHGTASGANKWVRIHTHECMADAVAELKGRGMRIYAAHLSAQAVDFRSVDYTRPTAILLGAELEGVSREAQELADGHIIIPMLGMVESLNVSVAAATVLYEAQRQRMAAGMYDRPRLDGELYRHTLFEWAHPRIAGYCRRHGLPYPELDEDGEIIGTVTGNRGRGLP
jgi:tRNA (guanosine-2'-O-)-methyltransferase